MAELEPPHPRAREALIGHAGAARLLAGAEAAGRLHHAWLVGGPEGIGKATLAYRFARFLLAPPEERGGGPDGLAVDPESRTARQIAAAAHPNLLTLELAEARGDKAAPKTIPVDAVRKVLGFFATTAADGGRRVCIVDSVDDLAGAGANALLKTVEEPPAGGLILLLSHAPQRVLPTIRSRCRKLPVAPLATAEVEAVLRSLPQLEAEPDLLRRAAALSEGSVARALSLLDPKRLALLGEVEAILQALPSAPTGRVLALAERLGDRRAEEDFGLALDAIQRWLAERVEAGAGRGPRRLAPLAEAAERLAEGTRTAQAYNLERKPFVVTAFADLAEAVRRAS